MSNAPARQILVVGPAWVGDMIMAQSFFKLLKQQDPLVEIDVLAPPATEPLLARMPEVRRSISLPLGHGQLQLAKRYRLGKSLRAMQYDQAIVLTNSWKSALIPFWARIPLRTGWLGEWRWGLLNDARRLDKQQLPLMIERFCALALPKDAKLPLELPWPHLQTQTASTDATCQKHQLSPLKKPILALCPGAEYGPAKRWPAEHFAKVAGQKLSEDWQVCLLGGPKDRNIAEEINAATQERCINLAGKTSLLDAIDLLSVASAIVTNDSGLMHMAAALQRPLVAVYGSSDPRFTPPLSEQAKILSLKLECSPCFKRTCPLEHLNCLQKLEPERVLAALNT